MLTHKREASPLWKPQNACPCGSLGLYERSSPFSWMCLSTGRSHCRANPCSYCDTDTHKYRDNNSNTDIARPVGLRMSRPNHAGFCWLMLGQMAYFKLKITRIEWTRRQFRFCLRQPPQVRKVPQSESLLYYRFARREQGLERDRCGLTRL